MIKRRILPFIFLILAAFDVSCASLEPTVDPLSEKLIDLANTLSDLEDCYQKSTYLESWMEKNASALETLKSNFDKTCPPGSPVCMSYQILGSAKIEVELRDCVTAYPDLKSQIVRLNSISGTAVSF